MKHIITKVIEVELHPDNMNREEIFPQRKSWKPLMQSLNASPTHLCIFLSLCPVQGTFLPRFL